MFSRKGSNDSDSGRADAKARNSKTSKSNQQYKSVLNSSVHGVFSIEDEEDDDDTDEIDDNVQIAFNDKESPTDSRNRNSQEADPKLSETQRKRRGAKGTRDQNRQSAKEKGQLPIIDQLYSFWSVITFSWMRPLLVVGNSRALEQDDLFKLSYEDSSAGVFKQFSKFWKKQLAKSPLYKANKKGSPNAQNPDITTAKRASTPSLAIALLRAFGGPFAGAGFLKLIHDSLIFVGPLALNKLIFILSDPTQPLSLGLFYVAAIFFSNFIMSLCLRQYFWWCYRVGMRLRSAVTTSIYSKALVLSTAAMSKRTTGEITNLMSVDSTRLQELSPYLHAVWYSFYQISIALYFLWQQMGVSSLAGIAVILLLIPLTGKVSTILKSLQSQMAKVRDERIKVSNEVLGGMKVIKFQAWEAEFEKRINEIRDRELTIFRQYCIMQSVSGAVFTTVPLLVSIVTFATYIGVGNELDVATALTSLALFEILRFPLFMLPNVLNNLVEAKVSIDRVQSFLLEPERELVSSKRLTEPGLFMKSSTLIWDGQNTKAAKPQAKSSESSRSIAVPLSSVFGAFGRRLNFLLGRMERRDADLDSLESGSNHSGVGDSEGDDKDSNPLILGDSEESHLMSVFRAQVDASEAKIQTLERDLQLLRASNATVTSSAPSVKPRAKMMKTSSGRDLSAAIAKNLIEDSPSVSPLTVQEVVKSDSELVLAAAALEKHSNGAAGSPSKVTDASDDKWRVIRNPIFDSEEESKECFKNGSPQDSSKGATDRLLTLSRISLTAHLGDLVAIVGQVGSGKSSILGGLLGDMKLCLGSVCVKGNIAYMGQRPFIQNSTLRDNITFGLPFDQHRYNQTLFECALLPDLKVLPGGDMTEIGERGINLSGGQKARVALARTVYADADIYLLDDPLAAVDAHVGQHLFEQCILTLKKRNKCIILVTNALQFLRSSTSIVVLREGQIVESGSYDDLLSSGYWLNEMIKTHMDSSNSTSMSKEVSIITDIAQQSSIHTETDALMSTPHIPVTLDAVDNALNDKMKRQADGLDEIEDMTNVKPKQTLRLTESGKLLTIEDKEVGDVGMEVYGKWLSAAGGKYVGIILLLVYYSGEAVAVLASWWLSVWSEDRDGRSPWFYLAIYVVINMGISAFALSRELYSRLRSWSAGRALFRDMLSAVLYAPMTFYDTTPLGRIINRFSKDIYTVDESIPQTVRSYLQCIAKVTGVILYSSVVTPFFIVGLVPICAFYFVAQRYYIKTSRELTRLESTSRSPIYALFGETLDGLSTIRAYKSEKRFRAKNDLFLDSNQQAFFLNFSANCWLAVRLEMAGTLIATFAALFAVLGRDSKKFGPLDTTAISNHAVYAGLAGLSISFALSVTQSLNWSVRMASDLESQMVSVERVKAYSDMDQEAPHFSENDPSSSSSTSSSSSSTLSGVQSGQSWPSAGEIQMKSVCLRYRQGLPLVLDNLTLTIKSKEKIGIVGRTGAGKSSLVTAILRMVEMESGSILIDGIDISSIGLHALRSRIAVIPQDPVLFSGTIRSNLDPFLLYTDAQIWENLRRTMLSSSIGSLDDLVLENGGNFSVGQRQLLCIARALLSKAAIIIMDEATAAVDVETDAAIQKSIREEFANATCLTVAHRLNTIMDSDKVLVMDMGRVAEFDSPANLLSIPDSMFSSLVGDWESSSTGE